MRYAKYFIPVLLILSACATAQYENFGSENTFENDQYDCQVMLGYRGQSRNSDISQNLADAIVNGPDEMRRCLHRKGWKVVSR